MHDRGACVAGGMPGKGACMAGGMHGGGHMRQGGMHGRGHVWQGGMAGGMRGRRACLVERACMVGGHGTHPPPQQILRDTVNERQYASYWNAFLFCNNFSFTIRLISFK